MKLIKTDVPCAYLNFFSSLLSFNLFIIGININCAKRGFYDKSVLETLSMGIINFYRNDDFNSLFLDDQKFYFENIDELTKKINSLNELNNNQILAIFDEIELKLQENSLSTLAKRLLSYL